ncbi:hypothetical protein LTR08_002293 [Meristemomyces frigidus]|nr:hypothetical protein LTR08_002293 [Meristemomyces frigidus]
MALSLRIAQSFRAVLDCIAFITVFWWLRLYRRLRSKTNKRLLIETLEHARVFEEWEAAAYQLDYILENYLWREGLAGAFDFKLINERLRLINDALERQDVHAVIHCLRSGLVRNLGNITAPKLYNRAYSGTKHLIEEYVTKVALAVEYLTMTPPGQSHDSLSNQGKLDLLHDARQAFGRTCLVLQGGSISGLCHLGVVKALHLRGLLPRIIAGTATGALMAALVAVHTEGELLDFLSGEGIDLSAFAAASERAAAAAHVQDGQQPAHGWFSTLVRRAQRFLRYGYVLDAKVLEECVRANVGDLTFEEAYQRTKRVLNITISATGGGLPGLLNYLTAPNVLIWSAALASNSSDVRFAPTTLQCKTPDGRIVPWEIPAKAKVRQPKRPRNQTPSTDHDRNTPLSRVAELFNVNHFIISQFLAPSLYHSNSRRSSREPWSTYLKRLATMEIQHRLTQMDMLGWLSPGIKRLLLDESVPGASWTLVPHVTLMDFARLLRNPTREEINYWILRGERSVWPAVCALKIRCVIEVELDRGYQLVRRRKPFDMEPPPGTVMKASGEVRKRKRLRAASMGAG